MQCHSQPSRESPGLDRPDFGALYHHGGSFTTDFSRSVSSSGVYIATDHEDTDFVDHRQAESGGIQPRAKQKRQREYGDRTVNQQSAQRRGARTSGPIAVHLDYLPVQSLLV